MRRPVAAGAQPAAGQLESGSLAVYALEPPGRAHDVRRGDVRYAFIVRDALGRKAERLYPEWSKPLSDSTHRRESPASDGVIDE